MFECLLNGKLAVGQTQWYHFGVDAPPILVYFGGDWDVHWGYGILTHGQLSLATMKREPTGKPCPTQPLLGGRRPPVQSKTSDPR